MQLSLSTGRFHRHGCIFLVLILFCFFSFNRRAASNGISLLESTARKTGYCEWGEDLEICYDLLKPQVPSPTTMWFFMGDSTLFHVFRNYFGLEGFENLSRQVKDDRDKLLYYGFQRAENWTRPNLAKGEGPALFGLENPFNTDCRGCKNALLKYKKRGSPTLFCAEFLTVEFARDVEFPTPQSNTSQETLSLYMDLKTEVSKEGTVCVANAGLHDMDVAPITTEVYVHNVREYLGLLQKHCSRIIWLSTSAVLNYERFSQRNDRIVQWNNAVLEMMSTTMDDDVIYMDVFNKSLHTKHEDNVHLDNNEYYRHLANMFSSLMLKEGDVRGR
jgi:hypothetical protein